MNDLNTQSHQGLQSSLTEAALEVAEYPDLETDNTTVADDLNVSLAAVASCQGFDADSSAVTSPVVMEESTNMNMTVPTPTKSKSATLPRMLRLKVEPLVAQSYPFMDSPLFKERGI